MNSSEKCCVNKSCGISIVTHFGQMKGSRRSSTSHARHLSTVLDADTRILSLKFDKLPLVVRGGSLGTSQNG